MFVITNIAGRSTEANPDLRDERRRGSERVMTALKRIEREPLWDLAHAQLRDALLAGRFEPGTVLTLRSLAESFG